MFNRPTLADIVKRTRADALSRLTPEERLRFSDPEVIARVLAGASHELHGYLDYIAKQVIPDTADSEHLERWGSIFGIFKKPANAASGPVAVFGAVGSVILDGTLIKRLSDGAEFAVDGEQTLDASPQNIAVVAVVAGESGNTESGETMQFLSPVVGVQSDVIVASGGIVNGSDIESESEFKARLIARIRQPPNGGAPNDYLTWALEVPGVTRAWIAPLEMGAGTVTVRFVRDNDASMIPDAGEIAVVDAYIRERKPVTAELYVVAPTPLPVNFTIDIAPDTQAVKDAVMAELEDLFKREAYPGGRMYLSHLREAVSIAAGETDHSMPVPAADIVPGTGEIPVLGVITWV